MEGGGIGKCLRHLSGGSETLPYKFAARIYRAVGRPPLRIRKKKWVERRAQAQIRKKKWVEQEGVGTNTEKGMART